MEYEEANRFRLKYKKVLGAKLQADGKEYTIIYIMIAPKEYPGHYKLYDLINRAARNDLKVLTNQGILHWNLEAYIVASTNKDELYIDTLYDYLRATDQLE